MTRNLPSVLLEKVQKFQTQALQKGLVGSGTLPAALRWGRRADSRAAGGGENCRNQRSGSYSEPIEKNVLFILRTSQVSVMIQYTYWGYGQAPTTENNPSRRLGRNSQNLPLGSFFPLTNSQHGTRDPAREAGYGSVRKPETRAGTLV